MHSGEPYYKKRMLELVSAAELNKWLEENPPPPEWVKNGYGKYAWACTEMPVGVFFTWWRKNILGWKI